MLDRLADPRWKGKPSKEPAMHIVVDRPHHLEPSVMRQRLQVMEDKLRDRYHTEIGWPAPDTMSIGGHGVRGTVHVDADRLRIELELSAALRPLKGRIEKLLAKELDTVTKPS
jgi:putative polyhydroxyalkanoate system protein